ncbi:MAG: lysylphosphatidylglycerol synthase domain-containing protein [Candidatus Bruticola sp.]
MSAKLKSFLFSPLFRLLTAFILLLPLVGYLNLDELQRLLSFCRFDSLIVGWLILGGVIFTGALSWKILLQGLGSRLSLLSSCKITLIAYAFNNLIPSGIVGELYRINKAEQQKIPVISAVLAVILEVWASACALAVAAACSLICASYNNFYSHPFFIRLSDWLSTNLNLSVQSDFLTIATVLFVPAIGSIIAAIWLSQQLLFKALHILCYDNITSTNYHKIYLYIYQFIKNKIGYFSEKLNIKSDTIYHNIEYIVKNKRSLTKSLYCAVIINTFTSVSEAAAYVFLAESLGLQANFSQFFSTVPLFSFVSCLPVSVNSLGTQEAAAIFLWPGLGFNNEEIITLSALNHIGKLLWSAAGLCLYSLSTLFMSRKIDSALSKDKIT